MKRWINEVHFTIIAAEQTHINDIIQMSIEIGEKMLTNESI